MHDLAARLTCNRCAQDLLVALSHWLSRGSTVSQSPRYILRHKWEVVDLFASTRLTHNYFGDPILKSKDFAYFNHVESQLNCVHVIFCREILHLRRIDHSGLDLRAWRDPVCDDGLPPVGFFVRYTTVSEWIKCELEGRLRMNWSAIAMSEPITTGLTVIDFAAELYMFQSREWPNKSLATSWRSESTILGIGRFLTPFRHWSHFEVASYSSKE